MASFKYCKFDVVKPVESVTLLGAGKNLYAVVMIDGEARLLKAGSLPLSECVELSEDNYEFILIK